MTTTRGGLVAARIVPVDKDGSENWYAGQYTVDCEFNPTEYTIKQKNSYESGGYSGRNYLVEFQNDKIEPRTLTLGALWFDTEATGDDVRNQTNKLLEYVEMQGIAYIDFSSYTGSLNQPPFAAFEWGNFRFLGVITSVKLEFVKFLPDGTPIRAKATVSFKEFKHRKLYAGQNPSSGEGPDQRLWEVSAGDRLDSIAAQVYGDATLWRLIAQHNDIIDPLTLQPGQSLHIPARWVI